MLLPELTLPNVVHICIRSSLWDIIINSFKYVCFDLIYICSTFVWFETLNFIHHVYSDLCFMSTWFFDVWMIYVSFTITYLFFTYIQMFTKYVYTKRSYPPKRCRKRSPMFNSKVTFLHTLTQATFKRLCIFIQHDCSRMTWKFVDMKQTIVAAFIFRFTISTSHRIHGNGIYYMPKFTLKINHMFVFYTIHGYYGQ